MQCYACGQNIPTGNKVCPSCGKAPSRMIYVHFCGVIGGIAGSLIGYTLFDTVGALAGGLTGIVACELLARLAFRPRRPL